MVRLHSPNRPAAPGYFSRRDIWRLFSLVLGDGDGRILDPRAEPAASGGASRPGHGSRRGAGAGEHGRRRRPRRPPIPPSFASCSTSPAGTRSGSPRLTRLVRSPTNSARNSSNCCGGCKTFDGPQLAAWARAGRPAGDCRRSARACRRIGRTRGPRDQSRAPRVAGRTWPHGSKCRPTSSAK